MLNRNFRLKFDLSNYDVFDIPDIKFCKMDNNTSILYVQFTNEGDSLDLNDIDVIMYILKPDGKEVLISAEVYDSSDGIVKFTIPSQALVYVSTRYFAELRLISHGRCLVTRPFRYEVVSNLSSDDFQMQSSSEYVLLVDALDRLSDIEEAEQFRIDNEFIRIENEYVRQESINAMEKNVNDKINEMNLTKVDFENSLTLKATEVDSKMLEVSESIGSIEDRFNSLAPEQATNVEVQLARENISGVVFDSLKARLDSLEKQPSIIFETIEG